MRAVSIHRDVILVTSAIWQTNCTIVRAQGTEDSEQGSFVIDSPVLPAELDVLPTLLGQAGFPAPNGLLATHGDWDHLLCRLAFPKAALGCAQNTALRLRSAPGQAQRQLRAFDQEHYITRERPLTLGSVQELPVPGYCAIGSKELQLHPAHGHTGDGMALWVPWARVLVAGDYLSAVEIPAIDKAGGSLGDYLATLQGLRPLVKDAEHVVPGHGPVLDAEGALSVLEQDLAYLHALGEHGKDAELPPGRRTKAQRDLHAENVALQAR